MSALDIAAISFPVALIVWAFCWTFVAHNKARLITGDAQRARIDQLEENKRAREWTREERLAKEQSDRKLHSVRN